MEEEIEFLKDYINDLEDDRTALLVKIDELEDIVVNSVSMIAKANSEIAELTRKIGKASTGQYVSRPLRNLDQSHFG